MLDSLPHLAPAFCRELARCNPWGRIDVTEDDVRSWFELVWPVFQTYNYSPRGVKRAVAQWWMRAREEELDRARERRRRIAEEQERLRMNDLQEAANKVVSIKPKRSYASRVVR